MSAPRTTRCIFCRTLPARPKATRPRRRDFSSTPSRAAKPKPAYPNVKAVDMGLVNKRIEESVAALEPYTEREKLLLSLKYTQKQMAAIEAGEAAIDLKDVVTQGRLRVSHDMGQIKYLDDFSKIRPIVDKPIRAPDEDIDPDIVPLSEDDTMMKFHDMLEDLKTKDEEWQATYGHLDYGEHMQRVGEAAERSGMTPDGLDGLTPDQRRERLMEVGEIAEGVDEKGAWERFQADPNNFFYSPKGTLTSQSDSLAPELPNMREKGARLEKEDEDPHM
ncbi:hypothetical protein LTR28_002365, partial [Elasticomyces elasticus]